MHFKQLLWALGILIIAGAVVGVWANRNGHPPAEVHPLAGVLQEGEDYEFVEDGKYYTVKATYPAETGLKESADRKARLAIEQSLAARIAEFKSNSGVETLTDEDAAFQGLGEDRKYALDLSYQTYSAPEYVSYLYTVYEDTGGAHPNTYFMSFVFDESGERVGLEELFPNNPNWLEELSLLVSNGVVAQYRARAEVEDTTGLLFEEGLAPKVENFSNFVIDGDTLAIFIPPYQVAAYAAGTFEVQIPLKDLE